MTGDFESFLTQEAPKATAPPADALAPPDDFGKFLAKAKGEQDTSTVQAAQATSVANVHTGVGADQAGQAAQVGREIGVPQAAVETDPATYQAQAKAQRNAAVVAGNPVLAKWVAANPDSARIAQDEYDKLSSVEKMWDETKNAGYGVIQQLGGSYHQAALAMNRAIAPNALAPWLFKAPDAQAWWQQHMIDPLEQDQGTFKPQAGVGAAVGGFIGSFAGMISQVLATGGQAGAVDAAAGVLPTIANAAQNAVRAMWLPAATAAVNTGHDVMGATGDTGSAVKAAAGSYLFNTLQGAVPFSAPGGALARLGTGFASGVATSEGQRAAMNLLLPPEMRKDFDIQEALASGAQGAFLGLLMGPHRDPNYAEAARRTYTDAAQAEIAQREIAKVAALGKMAAESKLRESDPDAFHDFVTQVTDRSNLDAVYVNGTKLNEAFAQAKIEPTSGIAAQMQEALATGGDVRIPVADYATHIAGTDVEKAILPEMKASPDGMTYREGQAFYQDAAKSMAEKVTQLDQDRAQRTEQAEDRAKVQQTIEQGLVAAGREPFVAKTEAALATEFYAAMGEREGMKASEFFAKNPVNFEGEQEFGPASTKDSATAELVQTRKRTSVLQSILECMA